MVEERGVEGSGEELAAMAAARRRSALLWAGVLGAGLLAFGVLTWALGGGFFAWRIIAYDRGEIYILNMTDAPVFVSFDGGEPIEVPAQDARRTTRNGGETEVETRRADGTLVEAVTIFIDGAPALYNVEGATCLALSDVSGFYLPGRERSAEVVARYEAGTRAVPLPSERIIWPRKTLQDEIRMAEAGVHWIEPVACPLLDPQEDHVLTAHLNTLLSERKRREKEEELKRKMAREGGDAVDRELLPELERQRAAREKDGGPGVADPKPKEAPEGPDGAPGE